MFTRMCFVKSDLIVNALFLYFQIQPKQCHLKNWILGLLYVCCFEIFTAVFCFDHVCPLCFFWWAGELLLKCLDGKYLRQSLLSINNRLLTCRYRVISEVACYRWKWFFSYRDASKVATAGVSHGPLWPCCQATPEGRPASRCRSGSAESGNQTHL